MIRTQKNYHYKKNVKKVDVKNGQGQQKEKEQ